MLGNYDEGFGNKQHKDKWNQVATGTFQGVDKVTVSTTPSTPASGSISKQNSHS
jgi:hypothetical protein